MKGSHQFLCSTILKAKLSKSDHRGGRRTGCLRLYTRKRRPPVPLSSHQLSMPRHHSAPAEPVLTDRRSVRYRRISPIAVRLGEGPLSDHAADVQPARRERVFMVELECDAGGFRSTLSVAAPFVWRCLTRSPVAPVSTPRSSNRTCRFAASGSRTRRHAFTHDGPRPSCASRTSPKCP